MKKKSSTNWIKTLFRHIWNALLVLFVGILANVGVAFLLMSFANEYRWNFLWGLLMLVPFVLWVRKLPHKWFMAFQIFAPVILFIVSQYTGRVSIRYISVGGSDREALNWLSTIELGSFLLVLLIQFYFIKRDFGWKTFFGALGCLLIWVFISCCISRALFEFHYNNIFTRILNTVFHPPVRFALSPIFLIIPQYWRLSNHGRK